MKRRALLLLSAMFLALPLGTWADVEEIPCIYDIVEGTTIDFEEPGDMVNDILPNYNMYAVPNKLITTFVSWVTGNDCAPINNRAGFSDGFRIETSGGPWDEIGMAAIGTFLYEDRTFTLYAYDIDDNLLGSVTKYFDGGYDFDTYNAGVVFLGLSSTTPIYAIELISDNPNVGWDHLRYHEYTGPDCPGDLDNDGDTDQADLSVLLADWGCDDPVNGCDGDLNGDDKTNQADLGILLADWGCGT
jgi:hypothetical protein